MRTHDHTSPGTGDCAPDSRKAHAILSSLSANGWGVSRNVRERDELARQQNREVARLRARLVSADAAVDAAAEWRHRDGHHYLTELVNRALDDRARGGDVVSPEWSALADESVNA